MGGVRPAAIIELDPSADAGPGRTVWMRIMTAIKESQRTVEPIHRATYFSFFL